MKKTIISLALAVIAVFSADGRTLSPAEALARANSSSPDRALRISRGGSVPVMTVGEAQSPALYVFSQSEGGYLVVSADDVAAPVLGYSDNGVFDPDNLSPVMRWWLSEYQAQIQAAGQTAATYQTATRQERPSIAPLLKTKWDQDSPYNKYCPKVGSKSTYTGCVATAMAQVMKYHNWPDKAASNAKFSYKWDTQGSALTADFSNFAFDWSNMLDDYAAVTSTTTQNDAVAKLMQACGYSVEMDYGTDASGTPSTFVGGALYNYFKYDGSLHNEFRQCYTLAEWEDLIYNSLKTDGPVLYAGSNSSGGHCFVCDGYQGNGYFHINWGWSGMSDGYFLLNALDPDQQGAGGSTAGYNSSQEILVGIRPAGSTSVTPDIKFVATGFLTGEINGSKLEVFGDFGNYSINAVGGTMALRITDINGNEVKVYPVYLLSASDNKPGYYYESIECTLSSLGLSNGTYRIYPVFRVGANVYPYQTSISQPGYILLTRSGSTYKVETPTFGDYSVRDLTVGPKLYLKKGFIAKGVAKFSTDKEVTMPICGLLLDQSGKVLGYGDEMMQQFSVAGESFVYFSEWFIDSTSSNYDELAVSSGSYKFAFGYKSGSGYQLVSDKVDVTVNADPGKPSFQLVSWDVENSAAVDPDNVVVNVTLRCTSGYFVGNVSAIFFEEHSSYADYELLSPLMVLSAGETTTFAIKGPLTGAVPGERYNVGLYYTYNYEYELISNYKMFTIGQRSGIADVIADGRHALSASPNPAVDFTLISASSPISAVTLYSLSGQQTAAATEIDSQTARVDVSALAPGLYIARVVTATGIETVKIIKK